MPVQHSTAYPQQPTAIFHQQQQQQVYHLQQQATAAVAAGLATGAYAVFSGEALPTRREMSVYFWVQAVATRPSQAEVGANARTTAFNAVGSPRPC